MTEKPPQPLPPTITITDPNGAPIVYFDGATNFGHTGGIVNVTLACARSLLQSDGKVKTDFVAVAFLRCAVPAAENLRDALNKALLAAAPVDTSNAN